MSPVETRFTVRLVPRGGADRIDGVVDGVLRARVAAPAVAGAANHALLRLLAADLGRYRDGVAVSAYRDTWGDHVGQWFVRYRTFILLVLMYLIMRTAFAIWGRG